LKEGMTSWLDTLWFARLGWLLPPSTCAFCIHYNIKIDK
jgi:hypothetical protein